MTWLDEERAERAELRQEMRVEFAKLAAQFSAQLTGQIHGLETTVLERIHAVDRRVAESKADLIK